MQTGPGISIFLHGAILGLLIFGGPLFNSDESQAIRIAEVSIITSDEFNSMSGSVPVPDAAIASQQVASEMAESVPDASVTRRTDAPETPEVPGPSEARTAEPDFLPDPLPTEAPELADTGQEATGNAVVVPDALVSHQDSLGEVYDSRFAPLWSKPRPAPRIDNRVNDKPAPDAEISNDIQAATVPGEKAMAQAETTEETAPRESTTRITPDAAPDSIAPIKSTRPKGRPADIVQHALAVREVKEKQAVTVAQEARKAAEAKAIADALKIVRQVSANPGPPLTSFEKGALVLAVQECWNVPYGVRDAGNLVVVLSVELTPEGELADSPRLLEPAGSPQGLIKQAYEAGSRALFRCAPYKLPREKYEQWKTLEVVFNPQKMVLR